MPLQELLDEKEVIEQEIDRTARVLTALAAVGSDFVTEDEVLTELNMLRRLRKREALLVNTIADLPRQQALNK